MKRLDIPAIREFFTPQRIKRILLAVALCFVLFFVCDDIVMPWFVSRGGTVQVPSVVGVSYDRAEELMDSLDLEARQGDLRTTENYPAGTVIAQNPNPGTTVKRGRRVYLVVSGGEPLVQVPNIRGKTVRDAKFALERNGLKLGTVTYTVNDSFPANTIIEQGVPPSEKMKRGIRISILVSQAGQTARLSVPDVIGKPLTEAGRVLANRGLRIGTVNYQFSATLLPNTVVDQFPRPGDQADQGQAVDLFVARGGAKAKPPTEN